MAKVKSVKFYNFVELNGSQATTMNVRFYDINGKLILIDFSNPISTSAIRCENSEYITTSYSSYVGTTSYSNQSFHIGNKNLNLDIPAFSGTWLPAKLHATSNDFLKIEFKFPQYISKIEILHSYSNDYAIDTMDYDVEFNDGIIKTYHFKSDGTFSPIGTSVMNGFAWNQDTLDSLFTELKFDKSKQVYDTKIGYVETLEANNFRNIPVNSIKTLKVLYSRPTSTILNCIVSFDKCQTWKNFDGNDWVEISDVTSENIVLNCMEIEMVNSLDKKKLISGGFMGDLDFKIAMKTNNVNKTPSVTKIYIKYK